MNQFAAAVGGEKKKKTEPESVYKHMCCVYIMWDHKSVPGLEEGHVGGH